MKIRVQTPNGDMDVLDLIEPIKVQSTSFISLITTADDNQYWFTSDGHYDGNRIVSGWEIQQIFRQSR